MDVHMYFSYYENFLQHSDASYNMLSINASRVTSWYKNGINNPQLIEIDC